MQRKIINALPQHPVSRCYQPIKATLSNLIDRLQNLDREKVPNKDMYLGTFKEINWSLGKCSPNWPTEVEDTIQQLRTDLASFEAQLISIQSQKKGSFFICGGGSKEKVMNLDPIYQRILGFEKIFFIVNAYQDRKWKEDIVYSILDSIQKNNSLMKQSKVSEKQIKDESMKVEFKEKKVEVCEYCELMKAVSVCPNGFITKKLVRELKDVQWIAGILYEEGKIVDKNMEKAVQFYEEGVRKKQPEAIYRLGLLNEMGEYGKPNEYLRMWDEAAKLGHLESMTDLGYLYENGLEDGETGKFILKPDSQKARKYYLQAVKKNFPRALNNLASFYYNDAKHKNPQKCLQYFERAVEAEYVKSLYNLGIIYYQGDLGVRDEEKYKQLIKRAAEKGDIQGKQQYIEIMLNQAVHGNCSEAEQGEINTYCRQIIAEEQDNPYAYYYLGVMYESGYGVTEEPKTAMLYYSKAARYPCPEAYIKMGFCYRNGFGVYQSSKDALKYFKSAVEALPQALVYMGQMYEKGYPDLKQNFQLAFTHYYDACNYQIPEAFTHLGYMYKNGRHVRKDEKKAEEYFTKGQNLSKKPPNKLNSSSQLIHSSYFRNKK